MSSICVDVENPPGQRKECGVLTLECIYPREETGISSNLRTESRAPEWADASEEVETSTKFEAASVPVGVGDYDAGALSQYQQKRLNQLKVATIQANYKYLADHPELKALLMLFLDHLHKTRPKNVRASAGEFFRSERTLARAVRDYLGMQFWKPPQTSSSAAASSSTECISFTTASQECEEDEDKQQEEEEGWTSAGEWRETARTEGSEHESTSQEEGQQGAAEPSNVSETTQKMMDMAESYDSRMILNLSSKRHEEKKPPISTVSFRKQVSFGGTLLPRTPGWEIDPTVQFFVEDIKPEISQLYGTEQMDTVQRKLKFCN